MKLSADKKTIEAARIAYGVTGPIPMRTHHAESAIQGHPVSAETIERCPNLKLIQSFGTGYNQIDLDAATARGIRVCNVPGYGSGAVAQMTIALLMKNTLTAAKQQNGLL